MTGLAEAIDFTLAWLKPHYEVSRIKEFPIQGFALILARHLGNTLGTERLKGQASFVVVETAESMSRPYLERHRAYAAHYGSISIVCPIGLKNDGGMYEPYVSVVHAYGTLWNPLG